MSPLAFSALFALVSAAAFAVGLRFYRMTEPRAGISVDQARRFGRLMMMAATGLLLFLAVVLVRGELKVTA